jgi:uncharacterized protein (DUF302 family)
MEAAMPKIPFLILSLLLPTLAAAQEATTYSFEGTFDDATFAVENAIINKGLVIDYVSHTGEMLQRTGADVGSNVTIFEAADVFLFCSAQLSREVMEADPMNIAHCPYGIFVADQGGDVMIGYRNYPTGEMKKVQAFLDAIAQDALGG